jgi:MFS family permease
MTPANGSFRWRIAVVLLPFAAGFYLSYLFRTINAVIADQLAIELGLSPAPLGLLTSAYFLTMAAAQLPVGVLLDRYGPRRVQSACLVVAAAGAAVFAMSSGLSGLMLGRALIGLGVGTALMSGIKAIALWFPRERQATMNGWLLMLGALGAVTATAPAQALADSIGWRNLHGLLSVVTVILAVMMALIVPEPQASGRRQAHGTAALRRIMLDPRFLRLAPLSALCIGAAWSMQSLWAAAWLARVDGLSRAAVVQHLLVMALALAVGGLLLGWSADRLRRMGHSVEVLFSGVALLSIACQLALVSGIDLPSTLAWSVIGAVGSATVLSYAIMASYFPKEISGQASGALNLLHVGTAFGLQAATGFIIDLWPPDPTGPPVEAYRVAFGTTAGLELAALVWFVVSAPFTRPTTYVAGRSVGLRPILGASRKPAYARAQVVYARHVASARGQAHAWRLAALGSAVLCAVIAAEVGIGVATNPAVPYVIEVDAPARSTAQSSFRVP